MQDLRQKDYETDMGYILFPFVLWETDNSHKRIFEPFAFYQTNKVLTYALKKRNPVLSKIQRSICSH